MIDECILEKVLEFGFVYIVEKDTTIPNNDHNTLCNVSATFLQMILKHSLVLGSNGAFFFDVYRNSGGDIRDHVSLLS